MGRRQRPIRHCTALATRAGYAAALDEGLTVRSTNARQTPVAQPVLRRPFDPPVAERGTERGETAQGIQGIEPFGRGEGGRHWRDQGEVEAKCRHLAQDTVNASLSSGVGRENVWWSTKRGCDRYHNPAVRQSKTSASVNATPSWSLPDKLGA